MKFCRQVDPSSYDFIPTSFNLPFEAEEFHKYQQTFKNSTFIAKPQVGAKGKNIALFSDLDDLPKSM
jgi:hypothetical protein